MQRSSATEIGRAWMRGNLTTQGYCLTDAERRELWLGVRFSTGLCLAIVITALALQSGAMVFAAAGIGLVAGFGPRHPFDYLWDHGVRHLVGAQSLPPSPRRRRDAFKVGTAWLVIVGVLLSAGAVTAGLIIGGMLLVACAIVTATNLCLPSQLFAWWERRGAHKEVIAT